MRDFLRFLRKLQERGINTEEFYCIKFKEFKEKSWVPSATYIFYSLPEIREVISYIQRLPFISNSAKLLVLKDSGEEIEISLSYPLTESFVPSIVCLLPQISSIYSIAGLCSLVKRLRSPDRGCPWDRQQSHQTLIPALLEEAYEVAEALERENYDKLIKEFGDLLLQIVFHSQIGEEEGRFNFSTIVKEIVDKLIRRHPHVFGEAKVKDAKEVLYNWELIKSQEENREIALPFHYSALREAQEISKKAAHLGFDWKDVDGVICKIKEELEELKSELIGDTDYKKKNEELGDLLFAVVNLARWLSIDAEFALKQANQKFKQRFTQLLKLVGKEKLSKLNLEELDELWEKVKEVKPTNKEKSRQGGVD